MGNCIDATRAAGKRWIPASPHEVVELLTELAECGSQDYRESEPASDALQQLMERLEGEERRLLVAYEEHSNHVAELWADDRFRLGYALGASGMLGWLGE